MIKTTVRSAKTVIIASLGSSREYLMYNREKNILGVDDLDPSPSPPPFSFNKREGAKSYDGEKAWSSIIH
jgi:hypothetical protein